MTPNNILDILGDKADYLLNHTSTTIPKSELHLPSPTHVDDTWMASNRNNQVLRSLQSLLSHGRLGGTGYCSIFPVDQGIEHSAGSAFAPNPIYFDPENIIRLAVEAGCNGVASTFGVLGIMSRKYAHKIPFIVKINHNEFLSLPNRYDQTLFGTVKSAWDMGAVGIGATIYWGSAE
ncbi:MAG TPA: fructose-bisphosphate aldolase, partial [Flavisolibacter sp.]|nr:fructose-bisphosphate aldolase [Flavisolibacter sp.]